MAPEERAETKIFTIGGDSVRQIFLFGGSLPDGRLSPEALAELKRATGLFMCGGDTRVYQRVYAQGEVGEAIRAAYGSGIPYAGLSAGAHVAPTVASVWGDRLTSSTNQIVFGGASPSQSSL